MSRLLKKLDHMLDEAMNENLTAQTYDETLLSKIESKMAHFLQIQAHQREKLQKERAHVRSLIGDISHQTKTPMSAITLYVGLLLESDLNTEQHALATQIQTSSEKLNFLIASLVKASRLESGVIQIRPVCQDVFSFLATAISDCTALAAAKEISLQAEFLNNTFKNDVTNHAKENRKEHANESGLQTPLNALLDTRWCGEALFNILENAIKYTPTQGCVSVDVTAYELFVRIDVKDTGCGISAEDLPKVFERFWRAKTSAEIPGVGIGLYLCRNIITACGGYMKVTSQLGRGSTFSVFLSKV